MNLQNRISDLDKTIKNIRTFSQPDIPGVYCEQYFKNIITNILKNEKNTFSFIFGDVNKLGELNNSFGFKFGDIALSNLLTLIKKNLPSNAYISRLGGDEFSFILPNTKKYECDEILDNLRQVISDNSSFVAGLSIEMASEDSTSGDLNTLHKLTDTQVSNNKHHRKNQKKDYSINPDDFIPLELPQYDISDSEKKSWIQLNNMINMTVCNFLQNIRPSQNLNFEQDQITDSSVFVADVLSDLLNESILQTNSTNSCEHNLIQKNIDPTIAKSIHNLVTNDNTNIEKIINSLSPNSINKLTNVLDSVLNDLVRDKSSDLLSKGYFRLYLAEKLSNSD